MAALHARARHISDEITRRRFVSGQWIPEKFLPLLKPSRYKGLYGGRGTAKSHTFVGLGLMRMMEKPTRWLCAREYQESLTDSVKRLIEDKIKEYALGAYFRILKTHIEHVNGGLILFRGLAKETEDSIKSLEGSDIAWLEEAQSISNRSLTILRPTVRADDSEIWASWNPRYKTDPIDRLLRAEPPNDSLVIGSTYKDNPYITRVLLDEMETDRRRDTDKYLHVWLGEYEKSSEARVFKNWRVAETPTPPDGCVFYYGADWGFAIDPTICVRFWISERTLYVTHEAKRGGLNEDGQPEPGIEIDDIPAFFKQEIPGIEEWSCTADSARPETISYLKRHGLPLMKAALKGANSVIEGVRYLQNFDIVVEPRCVWTIKELTEYSYKRDPKTEHVTPILEDKKNHVIDSLRYAIEDVRLGELSGVW